MSKTCLNCGRRFSPSRSDQIFCSPECRYRCNHRGDLVLTLKQKWFNMILSGEKTEEYREIKAYWTKRFENYFGTHYDGDLQPAKFVWNTQKKDIIFRNGYQSDAPQFSAECTIREGTGNPAWGAEENVTYYILTIHRIYNIWNPKDMGNTPKETKL